MVGESVFIRPAEQKGLSACYRNKRKRVREPKNLDLAIKKAKEKYCRLVVEKKVAELKARGLWYE